MTVSKIQEVELKFNSSTEKGQSSTVALDTLAQLGTKQDENDDFALSAVVGRDDKQALKKRARRKYFTVGLTTALVDAAKQNERSNLERSYWNTYHCAAALTLRNDGKVTGRYCKNRWCMVCNSIRTAQLITQYEPVLSTWDKYLITLTIPNVEAKYLRSSIRIMHRKFRTCYERMKKQAQRGQRDRFKGLRKMECTYNPSRNDFHPHYHVIVNNERNGADLITYWLEKNPSADRQGQDMRRADDRATMEVFKYFTKVISGKRKGARKIYADAMDVIFNAVKGARTFQPFGLEADDREAIKAAQNALEDATTENIIAIAEYVWNETDWEADVPHVDPETGELSVVLDKLSGYNPGEGMRDLVSCKTIVRYGHNWTATDYQSTQQRERAASVSGLPKLKESKPSDFGWKLITKTAGQ